MILFLPYRVLKNRINRFEGIPAFHFLETYGDKPLLNITGWDIGVLAKKSGNR